MSQNVLALITSQLAKASALALISMVVILITVISQGAKLPLQEKGDISRSLFINSGIFQAIGVISFGQFRIPISKRIVLMQLSVRVP